MKGLDKIDTAITLTRTEQQLCQRIQATTTVTPSSLTYIGLAQISSKQGVSSLYSIYRNDIIPFIEHYLI